MIEGLNRAARRGWYVAAALICMGGLYASPAGAQTCIQSSQTGNNNGNFFSFWKDSPGTVNFCMYPNGRYTSNWSGINNWVGGKGWATGSNRTVTYSGTFNSPGNGYLTLYGWTTNPLIECTSAAASKSRSTSRCSRFSVSRVNSETTSRSAPQRSSQAAASTSSGRVAV